MSENEIPEGVLFSRAYLTRGEPLRDSQRFRRRLSAYLDQNFRDEGSEIANRIHSEIGVDVPRQYKGYDLQAFFEKAELRDVLDTITIVAKLITEEAPAEVDSWLTFVKRTFHEESMGYCLDSKGGVRFFVDQEFERNRLSALSCLSEPQYRAVLDSLEKSFLEIDQVPSDTKNAVREIFEAMEILTKLLTKSQQDLDEKTIRSSLKPLLMSQHAKEHASVIASTDHMVEGLVHWVNAGHKYRHGQKTEVTVAPSLTYAVLYLSTGAGYIRWLVTLFAKFRTFQ